MTLMDRLREDSKGCPFPRIYTNCQDAATALDEALAIARELARLACCMDAIPQGSIGTQVARLDALERQELFVNQAVVTPALEILWRLFRHGRIAWHGAFVNLATGRVNPLPVDPQTWARMGHGQKTRRKTA